MNYALTGYPLSRDFRNRFEQLIGATPEYVSLPELRKLPPVKMLQALRSLRAEHLFLPLEDVNSTSVLPVLRGIAALTSARRIEVVHPDLRREGVVRWQAVRFASRVAVASMASMADARRCAREMRGLTAAPRTKARPAEGGRVLYLNANLWFGPKAGGSVGHIAGVANELGRRAYQVDYTALSPCITLDPGLRYHAIQAPPVFGFPFELNYYRVHRSVVDQVSPLAASGEHAFLYQRMSLANYAGPVLSRRMGLPLVLEYNGSEVWAAGNWGSALRYPHWALLAEEVCLKHAHLVVTVSDVLRDELVSRGVAPERIVSYPNCIDPQVFDPGRFSAAERLALRQGCGIAPDAVVATFVGTFGAWHGVEVLAQAIRRLIDEDADWLRRSRLHFLLVGDGVNMPKVRETLAGEKYAPFYTLTGIVQQDQAPAYLAISDFLLSPHVPNPDGTRFFGSPTKLFEYMAMGKGIVASDLDQIGHVLQPGIRVDRLPSGAPTDTAPELAVLCTPGDVGDLVRGIRFLGESAPWRQHLGQNARKRALSRYTWSHHVQAILDGLLSQQHQI